MECNNWEQLQMLYIFVTYLHIAKQFYFGCVNENAVFIPVADCTIQNTPQFASWAEFLYNNNQSHNKLA